MCHGLSSSPQKSERELLNELQFGNLDYTIAMYISCTVHKLFEQDSIVKRK